MTAPTLTVSGVLTTLDVPPRTSLADLIREKLRLTGTHLGCEHGVCGACTVLMDGKPVRSCIVLAASCEGRDVRPIEAFDDDAVMAELRLAFRAEHALQCGFCTPGMLIASRDIVLRLPHADAARIRRELSGNLCRCTGYVGIVKAVERVLTARRARGEVASDQAPRSVGRRGGGAPSLRQEPPAVTTPLASADRPPRQGGRAAPVQAEASRVGWTRFGAEFTVAGDVDTLWRSLSDFPLVASCLPGVELIEHDGSQAKGRMTVKLGPMRVAFVGSANIDLDDAERRGHIQGAAGDRASGSRTKGEASFQVMPDSSGSGSRVSLDVAYKLHGPLAQFSRSGLVQDFGRRLVAEFAANLDRRLRGEAPARVVDTTASVDAGRFARALIKSWLDRLLYRIGLRR